MLRQFGINAFHFLCRGKFANVRKATHKITGVHYAAKYIKKRRRAVDQTPEIHHEIAVLMKCADNSRVVRLHQVYETNSDVVLMLELAAGGELQQILDQDEIPTELEARRAMKQVLEGLSHLHERNIAHLDLKPQNILLSVENVCDDIKLCDFGVSRVLEPGTKVQAILGKHAYVFFFNSRIFDYYRYRRLCVTGNLELRTNHIGGRHLVDWRARIRSPFGGDTFWGR